ncbi:MAG: UDP-glucose/GDP-mannose dehydrogenase dimerization [Candidatus Woesebacteria bacterium GW2011_GWB1_43_14]|uniref:UDP-glucose/GDP-mannose dehydrogenase dimerization n=1 Tax=Candidatus Woesebacteria bacterium GW2011_GWB1_43_14 TaxID=1618578 RepID=A0A0G1DHR3_9BACT|nr:MAG: UDP-glucose/GDP-mannose dehydrogenase dimerization [Candidatus Woesebacteria bacterium GW2011_GWA1_39_11b]KKS78353.1 MAG: UDP-glucose/GDP-mannose dehydrogenase dimerization [Candidatus Woesebacteria bacterium GW2011_GWC1_42_9]KKS97229.1 MAG: UDP-glucose/GDP-mannose dehydrogenase dimerization [Candidatus Woesebacteria bacterium GW2011_GWB1_43_14]
MKKEIVGILGKGEIGTAIAKISREAGYKVLVREIKYDQMAGNTVDFLHVNIPEKNNKKFVDLVVANILELEPRLTVINSSVTPGTTRKIFNRANKPIVHSPVIGIHPQLYKSIKVYFKKVIGPTDKKSLNLAKKHFKKLGLNVQTYDSAENSESAKLLDLIYYAWNIVFCKWVDEISKELKLNFNQVYTINNQIYNQGYKKLRPNVIRPVLTPTLGPIGGHCTVEDTILFDRYYKSRFTKFILGENERYKKNK